MLRLTPTFPGHSPPRILCLGAHSDDIEIGCGGTILTLLQQYPNLSVHWMVFSGDEVRAREARDSAAAFLASAQSTHVVVKTWRDGFFPTFAAQIKEEFESLKRSVDPDLIFTHFRNDRHQDHRLICDLTWNTFRNHLILEYEIPKYDGDLEQPNLFVPLEDSVCSRKIQILVDVFQSQRHRHWFDAETFRSILRLRGVEANSPTRYAEAFYCRKAVLQG